MLDAFLQRNPNLTRKEVALAYHGTRNVDRVSHIMHDGLDPSQKSSRTKENAYFAVNSERCTKHQYDELILFVLPKSAIGTVRDAFDAHVLDALPVAVYQRPTSDSFRYLLQNRLPKK